MPDLPDLDDVVAELFDRQPETDMVPTLARVSRVMELLGDPQRSPRIVHLTGTNGKTSTARMIEALVLATGLRVGTYTSPHLESVTERIRIDGAPVGDEAFVAAYEDIRGVVALVDHEEEAAGRPALTFFEVLTCLAFWVFADAPVDVAVVEVGLGGRWDATNVADADVAVVTPIALDHQRWLGAAVTDIAAEKAGIVKPGSIAVIAAQEPVVLDVVLARCAEVGAEARVVGRELHLTDRSVAVGGQVVSVRVVHGAYDEVFLSLLGPHQADNALLAIAAAEALLVGESALDQALVDAIGSATSPGRLEAVRRDPTVLLDAAHNPAGADALAVALADSYRLPEVTAVVGIMADKDVAAILHEWVGVFPQLVVTQADSPRSMPAAELAEVAGRWWAADAITVQPDLREALALALDRAGRTGAAVVVTGSVVTVGQARAILNEGERGA